MIKVSKEKRDEINSNQFYSKCCHMERPDGHISKGRIQMEHPFGRSNNMSDIVVPVCSSCNYSPDKKTKCWSKLVAISIYTIAYLSNLNHKKDWDAEWRMCSSFFY